MEDRKTKGKVLIQPWCWLLIRSLRHPHPCECTREVMHPQGGQIVYPLRQSPLIFECHLGFRIKSSIFIRPREATLHLDGLHRCVSYDSANVFLKYRWFTWSGIHGPVERCLFLEWWNQPHRSPGCNFPDRCRYVNSAMSDNLFQNFFLKSCTTLLKWAFWC